VVVNGKELNKESIRTITGIIAGVIIYILSVSFTAASNKASTEYVDKQDTAIKEQLNRVEDKIDKLIMYHYANQNDTK
jgi:gas vesicle protein